MKMTSMEKEKTRKCRSFTTLRKIHLHLLAKRVFINKVLLRFHALIGYSDTAIQLDGGSFPGEEPSPGKIDTVGAELHPAEVSFNYVIC